MKTILTFFLLLSISFLSAQKDIKGTILSKSSNDTIPFANIYLNDSKGTYANEEGNFLLYLDENELKTHDSISISSIGFKTLNLKIDEIKEQNFYLEDDEELETINVLAEKLSVDEIIERIQDSIEKNYNHDLNKDKIFYRETYSQRFLDKKFKLAKSSIKEVNQSLLDSFCEGIPNVADYFIDYSANYYFKNIDNQKLELKKATQLYDAKNNTSFDDLQKRFEEVVNKNVKSNSELKIKSGLFGTTLDSTDLNDENIDNPKLTTKYQKNKLNSILKNYLINEDSDLDFIFKDSNYIYEMTKVSEIDDEFVYEIVFNPDSRSAKFEGKMYVSTETFAILRADYKFAKGKYGKAYKALKLFNIDYSQNKYIATLIYKNVDGKYIPKYFKRLTGEYYKFDRPIKMIEKNKYVKGRNKQNEVKFNLFMKFNQLTKQEILFINSSQISVNEYSNFKEPKEVKLQSIKSYDASFWKDEKIIEPVNAMKEFNAN